MPDIITVSSYEELRNAAENARDGDTIIISEGNYTPFNGYFPDLVTGEPTDVARPLDIQITASITIIGEGNGAVFDPGIGTTPDGEPSVLTTVDKGLFVVSGDADQEVTFENITFQNIHSISRNGAGIRIETGDVTIRDSTFIRNDNGVLGTALHDQGGTVRIVGSEFSENGYEDGKSHAIYVHAEALYVENSYIHDTIGGHHIKSTSFYTEITGNDIFDGTNSAGSVPASHMIDMQAGGNVLIEGNTIIREQFGQGPQIINYCAVRYGNDPGESVLVTNNVIINNRMDIDPTTNNDNPPIIMINRCSTGAVVEGNTLQGFDNDRLVFGITDAVNNVDVDTGPIPDFYFGQNAILGSDEAETYSTPNLYLMDTQPFNGLGGDDILIGGLGRDTLIGGDGDDVIYGGLGTDVLIGGAGDDLMFSGKAQSGGVDFNYGNEGNDIQVIAQNGNGHLYGDEGHDVLLGGNFNDFLLGGTGNDIMIGGNGKDRVYGSDGNDILFGGGHRDEIRGGEGADISMYKSVAADYKIQQYSWGDRYLISKDGEAAYERYFDIEYLQFADAYYIVETDTYVDGYILSGLAMFYGPDAINLNTDTMTLDDLHRIQNLALSDELANLHLLGDTPPDTGGGDVPEPTIVGTEAGREDITGTDGDDVIYGGGGLYDVLSGGAGDDAYIVDDGSTRIKEAFGGGYDTIYTSAKVLVVASEVESFVMLPGAEFLAANRYDNLIVGNADNNTIKAFGGDDIIRGDAGDDEIWGGPGDDEIWGGDGIDTAVYQGAIADFSVAYDTDGVTLIVSDMAGGQGTDRLRDVEFLRFDDEEIAVPAPPPPPLSSRLETGGISLPEPTIEGTPAGGEILTGTDGDDVIYGGGGDGDEFFGGLGNDIYIVTENNTRIAEAYDGGYDTIYTAANTLVVASEVEEFVLLPEARYLMANRYDNAIHGNDSDNVLKGGGGDDRIWGKGGNDEIWGGPGDDEIWGGDGIDTAAYQGNMANYDIAFSLDGSTLTITDLVQNDGTDTLHEIEWLQFDDQTIAVPSASTLMAAALDGEGDTMTIFTNSGSDDLYG